MNRYSSSPFRDPRRADAEGLVGFTPRITPALLLQAYSRGIFPWSDRPARWYSPDPRSIFDLDAVTLSKRLRRLVRQGRFQVTFDRAFTQVMLGCKRHHQRSSWISNSMIEAYRTFHEQGYAHSVEVWKEEELVGGLYGVQVGAFFAGESMFFTQSDASKVGFAHLVEKLRELGVELFDSQVLTEHTASLGAFDIRRMDYLERLERAVLIEAAQRPWSF